MDRFDAMAPGGLREVVDSSRAWVLKTRAMTAGNLVRLDYRKKSFWFEADARCPKKASRPKTIYLKAAFAARAEPT